MDPEQTFIRVQERFSHVLTPRIRASLEYIYLLIAITLFCILVVMHANYVQQPGCSSELTGVATTEAQLIQIKITSAGLWSQSEAPSYDAKNNNIDKEIEANGEKVDAQFWSNWLISSSGRIGKSGLLKLWRSDNEVVDSQHEICTSGSDNIEDSYCTKTKKDESRARSAKESLKVAILRKWHGRFSFLWRHSTRFLTSVWDIAGIHLNIDINKCLRVLHLDKLNSLAGKFWLYNVIRHVNEPSERFMNRSAGSSFL